MENRHPGIAGLEPCIQEQLDQLRVLTASDFTSLAWSEDGYIAHWILASGSRSDRFKRLALRRGWGPVGQVLRSGRPAVIASFSVHNGDDPREHPLMLAEGLVSAAAAPVEAGCKIRGVLLAGSRSERGFSPDDLALLERASEHIGAWIRKRERSPEDRVEG